MIGKLTDKRIATIVEKIAKGDEKKGILLFGDTGSGKTLNMLAVYEASGNDSVFVNWVDFMFKARSNIEYAHDYLQSIKSKKYIFIDDLGVENKTEFNREMVYSLVNHVYMSKGKYLFISTNLDIEGLSHSYDDRVVRRLGEVCNILQMKCRST